jgi:hypothetical protein
MSKTTKTIPGPKQASPLDYSRMFSGGDAGLSAVMEANRSFLNGMSTMSEEIGRFVSTRLQEDVNATRSLMRCTTPEQAMDVQFAFAQTATRQYFEQAGRLMSLAIDIARANCAPLQVATEAAETVTKAAE